MHLDQLAHYRASLGQVPNIANGQLADAIGSLPGIVRERGHSLKRVKYFVVTPDVRLRPYPQSVEFYAFHTCRTSYAAIVEMLPFLADFYDKFDILPLVTGYPRQFAEEAEVLSRRIYTAIKYRGILFDEETWR